MVEDNELGKIGLIYDYAGSDIKFLTSEKFPVHSVYFLKLINQEESIYALFKIMDIYNIITLF